MNRISGTLALCLLFVFSACGGSSPSTSTCTGSDCVDTAPADTHNDWADSGDGQTPVDLKDLAEDLPDFSNTETTNTEVLDVGPVEGGFGWPCAGPADCDSGYCIDSVMGAVCTVSCVEECPEEGWRCELFSGLGPDSVFVCLPPETALCRPCGTDADCDLVDGETAHCVATSEVGHFCGTQCDPQTEGSCPSGYQCQTATGVAGQHTVCVAEAGDCPCLYGFVGLATGCSHSDDSGTCTGSRTCNKVGSAYQWTECSAPYPAPESCNSIDDDCNGVADDGLGETTCGLGICEHTVVACKDGVAGTCDPYAGSTSEKCNGLDDDCDGDIDESWPEKAAPCDGPDPDSCQNGQLACDGGGETLICVNDDVGFVEECNGLDDDCDGFTDEVDDLGETTCGLGVCEHTEANCQDGELVECHPLMGVQESDSPDLEHLDTNCDGVDGDIATSVFVDVVSGAPGNLGTPESPLKSISAGLLLAANESKPSVLVSLGVYDETVTLMEGISIYGGYDQAAGWSRAAENVTQIKGGTKALIAQDLNSATVVQRIHITSEAANVPGASSHAVFVSGGAGLILDSVTVQAGAGAAGQSGSNGTPGLNGSGGSNGSPGCQYGCYESELFCFGCLGLGICGACGQPYGASGGASPCNSKGGNGGNGGASDASGTWGVTGQGSGGGAGGAGGTKSHNGTAGLPGSSGTDGDDGIGGGNFGMAGASGYVPASGEFGEDGTNGSGGGGGGGGGGKTFSWPGCCTVFGSSGGGGGGGGCHGTAGTGGGGGGGSFGIYVASGGLTISSSTVKTGVGGTGGTAGLGREGGAGGGAGAGGPKGDDDTQGLGAGGATGGNGGAGGDGGGGGGGPSVGIVCGPGATLNQSDLNFQIGQPGSGGFSNTTPGVAGLQAEVRGCP